MKISVFTGPYFDDNDPEMYGVRIPLAFWKIIAFIHDETGKLCATGYEMNQEQSLAGGGIRVRRIHLAAAQRLHAGADPRHRVARGLSFGELQRRSAGGRKRGLGDGGRGCRCVAWRRSVSFADRPSGGELQRSRHHVLYEPGRCVGWMSAKFGASSIGKLRHELPASFGSHVEQAPERTHGVAGAMILTRLGWRP